jgi:hypothetical protein
VYGSFSARARAGGDAFVPATNDRVIDEVPPRSYPDTTPRPHPARRPTINPGLCIGATTDTSPVSKCFLHAVIILFAHQYGREVSLSSQTDTAGRLFELAALNVEGLTCGPERPKP